MALRPARERALALTKACSPSNCQTNPMILQKAVAGVNQGIITLTLALGELDRQMHDAMRGKHGPRERGGGVR